MKFGIVGAVVGILGGLACSAGGGTPPPPAQNSGASGAFGVITLNGKQLMYYPTQSLTAFPDGGGTSTVTVIDVGQKGNGALGANAQVATVALNSTDLATTTAGDSNVVLAAGTATYNVWFIDPNSNTLIKTLALDPSLNGSSFSGGGGIVTGIAMDEANNRAILSVWNGFLYVDLASKTITGSVISAPAENFGFDGLHGLIGAPFYGCGQIGQSGDGGVVDAGFCLNYQVPDGGGTITAGVNVVKVASGKVYSYYLPNASDPTQPLGSEPDSAAFDPGLQLLAVQPEGPPQQDFLDLSQAVYSDATGTFTAPLLAVPTQNSYEGVAIETRTHLALFENEGSANLALVDLTKLNADAGLPPQSLVESAMPDTPATDAGAGGGWSNQTGSSHDPHGITVSTALQDAGPVGFLVSDNGYGPIWVARLDLAAVLALGTTDGGTVPSSALAPAITLLNGSVHE